jgi:4-amino-4-deoxy-L-arabinose transferase-like glycosyltransferase
MNPLFIYTTGLSWNHDSSILLAVLAFLIHCHSLRQKKPGKWLFLSGLSLGLAIGFRLSFALCVIPFIITILLYSQPIERKRSFLLLHFASGMFVSLLPALIMFVYSPKQFLFGNIYWRKLNVIYFQNLDYTKAMSITSKRNYLKWIFIKQPGNFLLFFAFIFFVVAPYIMSLLKRISSRFEVVFILMLLPCILIGSLAATPTWYQYYYALVPFMLLGILYNVSSSYEGSSERKGFIGVLILITLISCIFGLPKYKDIRNFPNVQEWYPIEAHRLGIVISDIIGEGRVLTLAPIFCLEGGLEIYEEFATGPFAWRTAGFLNERNRKELKMYAEDDLPNLLKERPPRGVLVGFERENLELERPFESFAVDKNYKFFKIEGRRLWVSRE